MKFSTFCNLPMPILRSGSVFALIAIDIIKRNAFNIFDDYLKASASVRVVRMVWF